MDIEEHSWSDEDVSEVYTSRLLGGDLLELELSGAQSILLDANDALAIAKHFKLTAEDLA